MKRPPWKVLLVDDDEDDFILVRDWLATGGGSRYELSWEKSYELALQRLESELPDALLVDYDLGGYSGLDFVREAQKKGIGAPILMLTGRGSYSIDLQAMNAGVSDYLSKGEVTPHLLERAIRFAIEHKRTERALLEAKQDLATRVEERTHELQMKNEKLEAEIARRQRAERDLAEVQRRLLDRVEKDRLALARDLHDGAMQELYGLRYQLKTFEGKLNSKELREEVFNFQRRIQEVIKFLRSIAGELRPPALAPFGLEKAIRSHVQKSAWGQHGVQIHLDLTPDGQSLPEPVRLALFRIYQVAMTNVFRHSQATRVVISLHLDAESAILEIKDDGRGFQVPERLFDFAHDGHLGLVGAAERAQANGGRLDIQSEPGKGTCVRVVVPLGDVEE